MYEFVMGLIAASRYAATLRRIKPIVKKINQLEASMQIMTDQELKDQTAKFQDLYKRGTPLKKLLPEAFATVREASVRTLGLRHFDVQLMGGIVMFEKNIGQMKTGEGKTLAATLPLFLHAIAGKGAHLVTVNDYLAQRDANDMGKIYSFLGMTVGCIVQGMSDDERKKAYNADITYGTNNEFAFDYLRDNMKFDLGDMVQRGYHYCIVDEVDSILIDEARTPLIISGGNEQSAQLYSTSNAIIKRLDKKTDYTVDEKNRSAYLSEEGVKKVQKWVNVPDLYNGQHSEFLNCIHQSLRAHTLYRRDVDYVVQENKIIIVDEFTGRLKPDSRWSDGLHQAVEAKENLKVKLENRTHATTTFQSYFRMYPNLAGMTGTAESEADEFRTIYNLDVIAIPTNRPVIRKDLDDKFFVTYEEKYQALLKTVEELHSKGAPVLVGTTSIEKTEEISKIFKKANIAHNVLNAKNHEKEAVIIADAGKTGAVTIATNMAGRGTDIKLDDGAVKAGGLHIIATERHEASRIDDQLRGRSGRQGDPGMTVFYLSYQDDLLINFNKNAKDKVIKNPTKVFQEEQQKLEREHFDIRKYLLKFDSVLAQQRAVIYKLRKEIMGDKDNLELASQMIEDASENIEDANATKLKLNEIIRKYGDKALKGMLLSIIDHFWLEHIQRVDQLKDGISLRSYAQKDPVKEFQHECFGMFEELRAEIKKNLYNQVKMIYEQLK